MSGFCTPCYSPGGASTDSDSDEDDYDRGRLRITSPCSMCSHDTFGDYFSLSKHYMDVHYHAVYTASSLPIPTSAYLDTFRTEVDCGLAATARLYETYTQLARWLWYYDHVRPPAFDFDDFIINPESLGSAVLTVGDILHAARTLVHSDNTRQFVEWRRGIRFLL